MPEKHGDAVFTIDEPWLDEDTGEQCYYLSNENYIGLDATESELREFMTAADASKRRLPTPDEFAKAYDWLSDPFNDRLSLSAADQEGGGRVVLVGRTVEGLPFYATVLVERIDWADKCCDHPDGCACTMGQAVRFAREHEDERTHARRQAGLAELQATSPDEEPSASEIADRVRRARQHIANGPAGS